MSLEEGYPLFSKPSSTQARNLSVSELERGGKLMKSRFGRDYKL